MSNINKRVLSCKSITSKIKFYEGLIKDGTIKIGGSAWKRMESLKDKKLLSRLSQNSDYVLAKTREANSL
jgi:hypothetical protein